MVDISLLYRGANVFFSNASIVTVYLENEDRQTDKQTSRQTDLRRSDEPIS